MMSSYWADSPEFEVTPNKRGLEPHEFESVLQTKLSNLFRNQGADVLLGMATKLSGELREKVCLQRDRTLLESDLWDLVARENYARHKLLPNQHEAPMHMKESTGGRRGQLRADREIIKRYHSWQHDLFFNKELLGRDHQDFVLSEECKGAFFDADGYKFTTQGACRVIDGFTCEFIRYLESRQVPPGAWVPENIPGIRLHCVRIVMGRLIVGWATENNLQNDTSFNVWKKHVEILISYAALVVVLDVILHQDETGTGATGVTRNVT